MICCHVYYFCWGRNQLFKVEVIDLIKKNFEISKQDVPVFKYLNLNIKMKFKCTSKNMQMVLKN